MTLIADSGSTKTTWMEVETGNKVVTEGLNPHFTTDDQFLAACREVRQRLPLRSPLSTLHFYGAGCGQPVQRKRTASLLAQAFPEADIHVETDMLGACRAAAGGQPGIVAILGTGSNACIYDGERIVHQPVSTGFILGDQGSANHVGRILLEEYLTRRMPTDLRAQFHDTYRMSEAQLLDRVYHQPHPNRFLASLAPFAVRHCDNEYCAGVITVTLEQWYFAILRHMVRPGVRMPVKAWECKLHVVGGYAKAIEPFLVKYLRDDLLTLASVVADPIDGLRRHHSA